MSVLQSTNLATVPRRAPRRIDNPAKDDNRPSADVVKPEELHRAPAVAVAVLFAIGIALDARLAIAWHFWFLAGIASLIGWVIAFRRQRPALAGVLLLVACLVIGGARHHATMSVVGENDISQFARDDPRPVRVIATVVTNPEVSQRQSEGRFASSSVEMRTAFRIRCQSIESRREMQETSGLANVTLNGELGDVEVGDTLDIRGVIKRPAPPSNPGEFDYRGYLERHGTRVTLFADHPEAIIRLEQGSAWNPNRWLAQLRARCERAISENLSEETAPVASALLLGSRSQIRDDVREAFAKTGTAHVLAISGLNVGILAGVLWVVCRLFNIGAGRAGLLTLILIFTYALLTGASPPVIRASILIAAIIVGRVVGRQAFHENTLAVAALVVLAWNPADLFDVGAQLSLLAVAVISWSTRFFNARWNVGRDGLEALLDKRSRRRAWGDWTIKAYLVTACIWLATTPLIAATFHVVSPVGLLVNVALIPVVTVVLWVGYAFLFCGVVFPPLAHVCGSVFDWLLSLMLWIVEVASRAPLSHFSAPSPPGWWLAGFYALLATLLCFTNARRAAPAITETEGSISQRLSRRVLTPRAGWRALAIWVLVGLAVGLWPRQRDGLQCTFVSVGHGVSVLVEFPNGRTLLYDAGSLDGDRSAARRIQGVLWDRNLTSLDAIVISHADVDHFNAVPRIIETVSTVNVITSRRFLDFEQQPVREMCEAAARENVPIHLVSSGDRLVVDQDVEIEVLHPRADFEGDDNATSVVLSIRYAGRQILLTGDLEGPGLDELLKHQPSHVDVLLSPHHGSKAANPVQLANWACQPNIVVASCGRKNLVAMLQGVYGAESHVHSTASSGAVTVHIAPDGTMRESQFLHAAP